MNLKSEIQKIRQRGDEIAQSMMKKDRRKAGNDKKISKEKSELLERYRTKDITVPKGPKFLEREKKETIKERKMREYLQQKEEEFEAPIKKKFKAKKPPDSSTTPMFYNIIQSTDQKRIKNKMKAKEKLLKEQKPFSFYDKDVEAVKAKKFREPEVPQDCKIRYKSKDLPSWYTQSESLKQQETIKNQNRMKRKEERKKKLLEEKKCLPEWNKLPM